MGGGKWSTHVYKETEAARKATGTSAFAYSEEAKKTGNLKAHDSLNPFGVQFRESRDSAEHPESNAVTVLFDVTGSMRQVPVILQQHLPQLLGLLLYKNYIPHPQILFGAVGDAVSDRVPLQVGQFESDNRMDQHLQNMVLEGGGGVYGMESYELALYFMARHIKMDCWEKRKNKGYLFMIGDEMPYPSVKYTETNSIIDAGLQSNIPTQDIIQQVKEKYNLYFIIPQNTSGGDNPKVFKRWADLIGEQHIIKLEKAENIAQMIALAIGTNEGTIDLTQGAEDLREMGADDTDVDTVTRALTLR